MFASMAAPLGSQLQHRAQAASICPIRSLTSSL
jgi:hypothetical protein